MKADPKRFINSLRQYQHFPPPHPKTPEKRTKDAFDRLLRQISAPEAAGRCMKCHTLDFLPDGRRQINWHSRQVISTTDGFTKFAHGPHMTLLSSPDQAKDRPGDRCETCHSVQKIRPSLFKYVFLLDDSMPNPDFNHSTTLGLTAVTRQSCVERHTASQAADSCLQCHNYHVHPIKLLCATLFMKAAQPELAVGLVKSR